MKVRIKFSKQGQMKFIGHLDIMRYFQKTIRRAGVDIAYSEGFSPHQKMSFAAPLGVGLISKGEYFDIEVNSSEDSEAMIKKINAENVEGIEILSYTFLPDSAKNCMAIVSGADYIAHDIASEFTENDINDFLIQNNINVIKKTKKSEKEVDIKPMIYNLKLVDNGIFMHIAQGSTNNLKPELVINALYNFCNKAIPSLIQYERLEMYYESNGTLVPLENIGE